MKTVVIGVETEVGRLGGGGGEGGGLRQYINLKYYLNTTCDFGHNFTTCTIFQNVELLG